MRLIATIIVFIFTATGLAFPQNPNLGAVGAQFLKLPPTARALGMSGAVVGSIQDASAIYWNPAGLAHLRQNSVQYSSQENRWMKYFNMTSVVIAFKIDPSTVLAGGLVLFGMDPMEVTTEIHPNGTGQEFDAQDMGLMLSYARNLTDRFSLGITGKYIQQRIWNEVAHGMGFDIGTQYNIPFHNLCLAMSMTNFGPDMQFDGPDLDITHDDNDEFPNRLVPARKSTSAYPLPLNFVFGLGLDIVSTRDLIIRTDIDAVHPNDNDERIQIGTEINIMNRLYLRGGYKWMSDRERLDEKFSVGFGLRTPFSRYQISIDMAYMVNNRLPNLMLYTIGVDL